MAAMQGNVTRRRIWLAAGAMTLIALVLYLPFRSASLDDFDSFNFVRALAEFAPAKMQPQPPGYVLYVWLARLAAGVLGEPRLALTTLSAVAAALACGVALMAGAHLSNVRAGLFTALFVMAAPLTWLNAEKALSDTVGLLAQAVVALLFILCMQQKLLAWPVALGLGVAAGLRPQAVLGLGVAFAMWLLIAPQPSRRAWLLQLAGALAAFAVGCLTWIVPLLQAFNWDAGAMMRVMRDTGNSLTAGDSLFSTPVTPQSILARAVALWSTVATAVFGSSDWLAGLLGLGAVFFAVRGTWVASPARRRMLALVWVWFAVQMLIHALFTRLELTRHALPMLLPAALLVATGLSTLRPSWLQWPIALVVALVMGSASLSLAQVLATQPSPPYRAATFIKASGASGPETLVIARQSYNALSFLLPDYTVRLADTFTPDQLRSLIDEKRPKHVVIADPETFRPGDEYVQVDSQMFTRDPLAHSYHSRVGLEMFTQAGAVGVEALALPDGSRIELGRPDHGKFLQSGWYRAEDIGGVVARWTGELPDAEMRVVLPADPEHLRVKALAFPAGQSLRLTCNGIASPTGEVALPQAWHEAVFELPADCARVGAASQLALTASTRQSPAEAGLSGDPRPLSMAVEWVQLEP
jgi:4-amino-4-deoxy-L-arabinose transferase-like glycosyltransferase